MDARGYRLGIDFGTSNTVAMLAWPDGHVRPLLFDGSPTLPSSVYADPQSGLLVGRDAMHAARVSPERFEPNPKRRIDEPSVLLGDHDFATADLIAAVLGRVAGEARRVAGGQPGQVTITCPAAWAHTRRGVLLAAAERTGLGTVALVPEPVAAAEVFRTLGTDIRPGSAFVVYDLGAGTFDASVVRHGSGTFEVLAAEGLSTSGGLDIDAAIVGYLGAGQSPRDPAAWNRLVHPTTSSERRANRLLWDDVRSAKEMLSRTSSTMIHIPMYDEDVPLGRDQFELLARPILTATVTATRAAIAAARLTPADIAGVFLVGGGSRIPLVATLLHQALGKAPTAVEQPELVVAQGSLGVPAGAGPATPVAVPTFPTSGPPSSAPGPGFPPSAPAVPIPAFPTSAPPSPAPVSSFPSSGPPSSAPVSGFPASAPPTSGPVSGPVSGSVDMPVSGLPMSAVPVSPGFAAAPVSGQPAPAPGQDHLPSSRTPPAGYHNPPQPVYPQPPSPGRPGRAAVPPNVYGAASPSVPAPAGRPTGQRRTGVLAAVAVVLLLVIGLGIYGLSQIGDNGNGDGGQDQSSSQTDDPGSTDGAGNTNEQVAADVDRGESDWTATAGEYDGYPDKTIAYNCNSDGTIGTVWGSGPYTTDSSVCTAGVHAGYITLKDGGRIVIKIHKGSDSYEGSKQHDIETTEYTAFAWEFQVIG